MTGGGMQAVAIPVMLSAAVAAFPCLIFAVEVLAACFRRRKDFPSAAVLQSLPKVAVLIPAHNEGAGLVPTVADIRQQLDADDRVIVVADNCSDDTAKQAEQAGAEVIVRKDAARRG